MKKRVGNMILTLLAVMCLMIFGSISVQAAGAGIPKKLTLYLMDPSVYRFIDLDDLDNVKRGSVKNVRSSNTKVAVASVTPSKPAGVPYYVLILPRKKGKATVSFTYVYKGKKCKAKIAVTVREYSNPFSLMKIGSNNNTSLFNKTGKVYEYPEQSGKLVVKTKKGWMLKKIFYIYDSNEKSERVQKMIKNGSKINLTQGYALNIILKNKKTKELMTIIFCISD